MIRSQLLNPFNVVAADKRATNDLTMGVTVHRVSLKIGDDGTLSAGLGNDLSTVIDNIVDDIIIKVNGRPERTHTGKELNDIINGVNGPQFGAYASGAPGDSGFRVHLPIWFSEPWRKSNSQVSMGAWNLGGVDAKGEVVKSVQIEVKVKSGVVSPVLEGTMDYEPLKGDLGMITKVIRNDVQASGTTNTHTNLDKLDLVHAMHFLPTSDNKYVNKLKVTVNGVEVHDLITNIDNQVKLLQRELNPDTSAIPRYDWVVDYDDPIQSGLPLQGAGTFKVQTDYSAAAAGNMRIITIRSGPLD